MSRNSAVRSRISTHGVAPDLKSLVQEVLRDGFAVNLGVSDASGPWIAPVVYVFDDAFTLYWISIAD